MLELREVGEVCSREARVETTLPCGVLLDTLAGGIASVHEQGSREKAMQWAGVGPGLACYWAWLLGQVWPDLGQILWLVVGLKKKGNGPWAWAPKLVLCLGPNQIKIQ